MKTKWYNGVGVTCPTCGAACSRIVERRDSEGRTFRTRVCDANKLHRFTTMELIVGFGTLAREARKFIRHTKQPK